MPLYDRDFDDMEDDYNNYNEDTGYGDTSDISLSTVKNSSIGSSNGQSLTRNFNRYSYDSDEDVEQYDNAASYNTCGDVCGKNIDINQDPNRWFIGCSTMDSLVIDPNVKWQKCSIVGVIESFYSFKPRDPHKCPRYHMSVTLVEAHPEGRVVKCKFMIYNTCSNVETYRSSLQNGMILKICNANISAPYGNRDIEEGFIFPTLSFNDWAPTTIEILDPSVVNPKSFTEVLLGLPMKITGIDELSNLGPGHSDQVSGNIVTSTRNPYQTYNVIGIVLFIADVEKVLNSTKCTHSVKFVIIDHNALMMNVYWYCTLPSSFPNNDNNRLSSESHSENQEQEETEIRPKIFFQVGDIILIPDVQFNEEYRYIKCTSCDDILRAVIFCNVKEISIFPKGSVLQELRSSRRVSKLPSATHILSSYIKSIAEWKVKNCKEQPKQFPEDEKTIIISEDWLLTSRRNIIYTKSSQIISLAQLEFVSNDSGTSQKDIRNTIRARLVCINTRDFCKFTCPKPQCMKTFKSPALDQDISGEDINIGNIDKSYIANGSTENIYCLAGHRLDCEPRKEISVILLVKSDTDKHSNVGFNSRINTLGNRGSLNQNGKGKGVSYHGNSTPQFGNKKNTNHRYSSIQGNYSYGSDDYYSLKETCTSISVSGSALLSILNLEQAQKYGTAPPFHLCFMDSKDLKTKAFKSSLKEGSLLEIKISTSKKEDYFTQSISLWHRAISIRIVPETDNQYY